MIEKVDGRVKLGTSILCVAILSTFRTFEYLAAYLGFYILLLSLTGFPVIKWMRRISLPALFVAFMSAAAALVNFWSGRPTAAMDGAVLFLRALSAIVLIGSAVYSMSLGEFLFSLKALGFPEPLVNLVGFTIRYANVLVEELSRMNMARRARGCAEGRSFWNMAAMAVLGHTVAALFLRSYERSEKVYRAMLSRGYGGNMKSLYPAGRPKKSDFAFGALAAGVPLFLKAVEMGAFAWITR